MDWRVSLDEKETFSDIKKVTLKCAFSLLQSTPYVIRVGETQKLDLQIPFATKIVEMNVNSYAQLNNLVEPLCREMNTYMEGGEC